MNGRNGGVQLRLVPAAGDGWALAPARARDRGSNLHLRFIPSDVIEKTWLV